MLPWSHAMPAVFRVKKLISEFEKAATIVYEQTADQIFGIKRYFHVITTYTIAK
jgi:hypothetical protein